MAHVAELKVRARIRARILPLVRVRSHLLAIRPGIFEIFLAYVLCHISTLCLGLLWSGVVADICCLILKVFVL